MRRLFIIAIASLALACGGDNLLGPVQSVNGEWNVTANGYSLSLNMAQGDTVVTGNWALAGVGGSAEGSINGTFKYPNLQLTLNTDNFEPISYTGTMSQTQAKIVGRLDGSGFNGLEMDVAKR